MIIDLLAGSNTASGGALMRARLFELTHALRFDGATVGELAKGFASSNTFTAGARSTGGWIFGSETGTVSAGCCDTWHAAVGGMDGVLVVAFIVGYERSSVFADEGVSRSALGTEVASCRCVCVGAGCVI